MLPVFSNSRRRQINLGGAQTSSTSQSILNTAKQGREQRIEAKRRSDASLRIQAWWRGSICRRQVRADLERRLNGEIESGRAGGLVAVRCLLIIRRKAVVDNWAKSVASLEVRSRQLARLLLENLTANTAKVLTDIVSNDADIVASLIQTGTYYPNIGRGIRGTKDKKDPVLPFLVSLSVLPFSQLNPQSELYSAAFKGLIGSVLSIALLPNRIPIPSLTLLSGKVPLTNLHLVSKLETNDTDERINILANLLTLAPPRYSTLPAAALSAYLSLLADLLDPLPVGSLNPEDFTKPSTTSLESDDETPIVVVVSTFEKPPSLPSIDPKTLKRLHGLVDTAHLSTLLKSASRSATSLLPLTRFLISLTSIWPAKREPIFRAVLAAYPAIIRELYRSQIRSATLELKSSPTWPPVLLVSQLYVQALLTMGDDEFFGTGAGGGKDRNPFTLDELRAFSKQLMGAAFDLYWRPPFESGAERYTGTGMRYTWLQIRESLSNCLVSIHSRDSRKPFTPQDHWLVNQSQIEMDMGGFVEAALFEEQSLAENTASEDIVMEDVTRQVPQSRAPKRTSRRPTSYLGPRLGILNNIPFAIPFDVRVGIFRCFVLQDVQRRQSSSHSSSSMLPSRLGGRKTTAVIRRGHVAEDGFNKLGEADLRKPVEIVFIDQFGQEEAGIDGGGVFKEFFTELCKEVFDTDRGLWLANKKNELYPSSSSYAREANSLNWYRFIGRILGKAMYEGILVDVAFAGFFLAKWLNRQSFLDDLESLDPDLYNGLIFLKHYEGNVEDLALNFTAAVDEFGVTRPIDLIPGGSQVPVTKENRLQYIQLISHFRLSKQIKPQSEAFFEGLEEVVDGRWLRMFNQQELRILIGGVNAPVDLDDLRKNTNYGGLYDDHSDTIEAFWKVANSFDQEDRRRLLRFVTSCSRPPLLGFKELSPNFSIRDAGSDQHRLPTSSTCVNLLKLPRYKSEKVLRQKLIQAINAGAGFDLS